MKKVIVQPDKAVPASMKVKQIRVKLDPQTTIILHRPSSLKVWKRQYPLAEVLD